MTPEQIQRRQTAWTVLRYEREMYEATWRLMQLNLHAMFHQHVVNAIVESHSLHIRNLCNFLAGQDVVSDDLCFTDLVERFEEIDLQPLLVAYHRRAAGHDGSARWVLTVISDCTIYRRNSYDYSSIAAAIHGPLVALMDQIEKVRIWEIRNCHHELQHDIQFCEKCGASNSEIFHLEHSRDVPPTPPEVPKDETTAEEPCQEDCACEESCENDAPREDLGGPGPTSDDH